MKSSRILPKSEFLSLSHMKIRTVIVFLALALSVVPARADWIDATIPGADFSVPVTIGTFTYSLPADSVITHLTLYSALYSFPAATDVFALEFDFDGIAAASLVLWPSDTEFFVGSDITSVVPFVTWDGSLDLSIHCWLGTSPSTFTLVAGDYWYLRIDFEPPAAPPAIPEPTSLLLLGTGLIGLAGYGKKKFFKK